MTVNIWPISTNDLCYKLVFVKKWLNKQLIALDIWYSQLTGVINKCLRLETFIPKLECPWASGSLTGPSQVGIEMVINFNARIISLMNAELNLLLAQSSDERCATFCTWEYEEGNIVARFRIEIFLSHTLKK